MQAVHTYGLSAAHWLALLAMSWQTWSLDAVFHLFGA